MKKIKHLIALTTAMALLSSQVQGQEYDSCNDNCCEAYCDSGYCGCMSYLLPIGAIAIAAIIIATTDHHHHGSSSTCFIHSHCDCK